MTRLVSLALLCLACGANSPDLVDHGDDAETGGVAGMAGGLPVGGNAGAGGTTSGGMSGTPTGGAFPTGGVATGGVFPTGGTATGGVFPMGGTNAGGVATGGSLATGGTATGGTVATGGNAGTGPTGGSAGAAGRLLWTQEFTYTGTTVQGTTGRYELKFVRRWPDDVCLRVSGGDVPHGMTREVTLGLGETLRNCLGAVPQTSPSRHTFDVTVPGVGLIGGSTFELPEDSRMWLATTVVQRITVNNWNQGAVLVRVTWEIRE